MHDPRIDQLAQVLVDHSCKVQAGDKVLIEAYDLPEPDLVCALIKLVAERQATPVVEWKDNRILRSLYTHGTAEGLSLCGALESHRMEQMDCYIGIRGASNSNQFSDVPQSQMGLYQEKWWHPVHTAIRVKKTRWVVLRYPTPSFAQAAKMSTQAFEDFYFRVCTADYVTMAKNQAPLRERMLKTDQVRLVAQGTDLTFSIKDIPVNACNGDRNIPDGEVFTAPVRDSANGVITYNAASLYLGTVYDQVRFEFKDGKIVDATCAGETEKLNAVLDADEGARYLGEFAIGCNNHVRKPMLDTLFDEKIGGSIHLTPGQAYESADNGNRSRVHWDLVLIQTPEYGGGEIYFDGELIRKDGKFVPADLHPLNEGL
ncbi:MAG: aminopeptidase [Planctomycetaceae bacterium]